MRARTASIGPMLAETGIRDFGLLPFLMLGLYLLLLVGIGVYGCWRSRRTEEDYYLAGRRQGFIVTALTIMAAFFSSSAMLGVPGMVYKDGVAFLPFTLNLPVAGCAIYLLGRRIRRIARARGCVTPGDMLADYYGGSAGVRLLVALLGFLYVVIYVVLQIRAGGHLAEQMFPGARPLSFFGARVDTFTAGAAVLSLVMVLYILIGGMRSVALADVVQGTLLLLGMLTAGIVAVASFGGVSGYFRALGELPPEALSLPGASGRHTPWLLLTVCVFASLASIIQPAQWMRMCAARSSLALKRSALIFSLVLPPCYLAGVMLVGLGARALYPPSVVTDAATGAVTVVPHEVVGSHDQALIALLRDQSPGVLGAAGPFVVMVILLGIIAASMSTADANLHALGAVLTRDVYGRFLRRRASERERAWFGRAVIVAGTALALSLVIVGERDPSFRPLRMIVEMQFIAMAASCQFLPVTIDMLFLQRGTRAGAVAGMIAGLTVVLLFTPLPDLLLGRHLGGPITDVTAWLKKLFDIGFCGFVVNAAVFAAVSLFTKKPEPARVAEFRRVMREGA